ncbi:hypothetical protein IFM58399_10147 [Aspergillus lentulus]|uniref:uncharacterized protein n=1 Tax=Aspergillus lentulus TaxID=293939 RepID=UPI001392AF99|nr:uncharacterized protein IFM58399_10147 [Aspergillus lentulus]GFF55737.1 hypothetical protein IFM58399_10147 [Aspergillus lentulus]GFF57807.1 hypothetical protein IFM62136_03571 [Aspergillus lentulus]
MNLTSDSQEDLPSPAAAAVPPMVTSGGRVAVVPVVRDGKTCPDDTDESAFRSGNCEYGSYLGTVPGGYNDFKCCYHAEQKVFLLSVPGVGAYANHKAKYILDGRPCCSMGEEATAFTDSKRCEYGNAMLGIPDSSYLTKCCWDPQRHDFNVHLRSFHPAFTQKVNKSYSRKIYKGFWGHETVGIDLFDVQVYGYYLDISSKIWAEGVIDWHQTNTFRVHLDKEWKVAKNWYPGSKETGHISIDVLTRVNKDNSVDVKGHITGTGLIFGRLEETVGPFTIDTKELKDALRYLPKC